MEEKKEQKKNPIKEKQTREKAESRSILRTKTALRKGLEELMQTKPVQQITVKELTDYVNLNRGTFYLHYKDIYDLLEDLENEVFASFQNMMDQHSAQSMNGHPLPLLKDIFSFIEGDAAFCKTVLGQNTEYTFVNKLKELIREKCFHDWQCVYRGIDPGIYDFLSAYVLSGCIGVIEYWLFGGMKESKEEMARWTEAIVLEGIRKFAGVTEKGESGETVWKAK